MRWIVVVLLFFAGFTPSADAQSQLCEPYREGIRLSFSTELADPTYHFDRSIQEVRQLYTVRGNRITRAHQNAIGLTYAETMLTLGAATRSVPRQRSGYCVYLEEMRATFGFGRFDVYVGSEYPRGSCEYRTILDHENEHVTIFRDLIREFGSRMRSAIEVGADLAIARLNERVQPIMSAFEAESRRRNGRIDTQGNYLALQELCSNWDAYRNF
jgi:hypothetical protein